MNVRDRIAGDYMSIGVSRDDAYRLVDQEVLYRWERRHWAQLSLCQKIVCWFKL